MTRSRLARAIIALGAGIGVFTSASPAGAAAAAEFSLEQVAPGVFVHFGRPLPLDAPGHDDIANIGFLIGTRCVAVIDTGGSVGVGRALREAIARRTPKPVCYVINTHVHVDHVLGDLAFEDGHASFIGHGALPAAIARNRRYFMKNYGDDMDQPPTPEQVVAPDRTV